MRLTARDNPETIRRYQHLRPAGWGRARCGARAVEVGHVCGRERDHRGPHAAHGAWRRVTAVWEAGSREGSSGTFSPVRHPTPRAASRRRPAATRPVGLRGAAAGASDGWLTRAAWRLLSMVLDIEELALFLMFVAFVYFAIDWLAIIFR